MTMQKTLTLVGGEAMLRLVAEATQDAHATVVSTAAARRLASLHAHRFSIESVDGQSWFSSAVPGVEASLDERGFVREGTRVGAGDLAACAERGDEDPLEDITSRHLLAAHAPDPDVDLKQAWCEVDKADSFDSNADGTLLSKWVTTLELTPETFAAIGELGATTLGDLVAYGEVDLLKSKLFNRRTLKEVKHALDLVGLRLKA